MVLRYWGERGLTSDSFSHLVDRSAAGIRTSTLAADLERRGWRVHVADGTADLARREIDEGRPVLALIQDRPGTFHYVVLVGWSNRGVIFHDPARTPFRVMTPAAFERRWKPARHWMLVLTPMPGRAANGSDAGPPVVGQIAPADAVETDCARLIEEGVRHAQARDLPGADRSLTAALGCPGPAPLRELAGVRVLQNRWPDAEDLAAAALVADPSDAHAWRLLATSRFVQDDERGALEAWNRVAEPRIDLVQVEGLSRTRHRVVEQLIGLSAGGLLTPQALARAQRRLIGLPAASSTRLEYRPVPSGLAEIRAFVSERPLLPRDRLTLVSAGVSAAIDREVGAALSSMSGGGERLEVGWRFWKDRPKFSLALSAPAPWNGIWALEAFDEHQAFSSPELRAADTRGIDLKTGDWATGRLAWSIDGGLHAWDHVGSFATTGGALRLLSLDGRVDAHLHTAGWFGRNRFASTEGAWRWRSSARRSSGSIGVARIQAGAATSRVPLNLWFAGDTGHVRPTLLRAHPVLDGGRLRDSRLGRAMVSVSMEAQHWWPLPGGVRTAGAVFTDAARVARRPSGRAITDLDAGLGVRLMAPGVPGTLRVDLAKGLRDGAMALSVVYEP